MSAPDKGNPWAEMSKRMKAAASRLCHERAAQTLVNCWTELLHVRLRLVALVESDKGFWITSPQVQQVIDQINQWVSKHIPEGVLKPERPAK